MFQVISAGLSLKKTKFSCRFNLVLIEQFNKVKEVTDNTCGFYCLIYDKVVSCEFR